MQTYYERYVESMNSIKNNLFIIQRKYISIMQDLERDYREKRITQEEYDLVKRSSIIDKLPASLSKYSLNQEDIEYIKEYGELLYGQLEVDLIKTSYREKERVLYSIYHSAIFGEKIVRLSPEELREEVLRAVINNYNSMIENYNKIMNEKRQRYGDKAIYDVKYSDASIQKAKLENEKNQEVEKISRLSDDELYKYAFRMQNIETSYFCWFKNRQAQETVQSETFLSDNVSKMALIKSALKDYNDSQIALTEFNNKYYNIIQAFLEYLKQKPTRAKVLQDNNMADRQKPLFMNKKKWNSMKYDAMKTVFLHLFNSYSIVQMYMDDIFGGVKAEKDDSIIRITPAETFFTKYLEKQYSDITNITLSQFIDELLENIKTYSLNKISLLSIKSSTYQSQLDQNNKRLNELVDAMSTNITEQDTTIRIFNNITTTQLPTEYIQEQEEQEIYSDIIRIINQPAKKEDIPKRKLS